MNKLWRKFDALSSECYLNMYQPNANTDIWDETYSLLVEIVDVGRSRNRNFVPELYHLEEAMGDCDTISWLDDYMNELEMYKKYDKLQQVCEELIGLFQWKEESDSELRFRITSAMRAQKRYKEALGVCEDWYKTKPDEVLAAVALIYARTEVRDYVGAEQIVKKNISEDTTCTDENDIVYTAAAFLYKVSGNKKAAERIKQDIKKYEHEIDLYFSGMDEEDMDLDMLDEDLPLN